jgi:hypothetical protein
MRNTIHHFGTSEHAGCFWLIWSRYAFGVSSTVRSAISIGIVAREDERLWSTVLVGANGSILRQGQTCQT